MALQSTEVLNYPTDAEEHHSFCGNACLNIATGLARVKNLVKRNINPHFSRYDIVLSFPRPHMEMPDPPEDEVDPSAKDLKSSIRPELLKRFRSQVLVMQPMTKSDYELLIPQFASCLPAMRQDCFMTLANEGIETAVKEQLGMRYFEEILTQTICSKMTTKSP